MCVKRVGILIHEEVFHKKKYEMAKTYPKIRKYCEIYLTSKSKDNEDIFIIKAFPLSLNKSYIIASIYSDQEGLGVIDDTSLWKKYICKNHPSAYRTSLKSHGDKNYVESAKKESTAFI